MTKNSSALILPKGLADADAHFMTQVLRQSGAIAADNEVVSQEEQDVGMTAGYFSAIKRVKCRYKNPTDAPVSFIVKTWPPFELLPKEAMRDMFTKDIAGYTFPAADFYSRPKVHLAASDPVNDRWVLVMDDADTFATHKVHEKELNLGEVLKMIPGLVDMAVAWEGCDTGPKADQLAKIGVELWTSEKNLAIYKTGMPAAAKFADKVSNMGVNSFAGAIRWDEYLGGPGICEMFTNRLDAFFHKVNPANGATCTLSHGDLRGDNLFFCPPDQQYPHGWLCIDYQLMFRGPVPSDLAYLMGSGSVLPEVYAGDNLHKVLRAFHSQFMAKTRRYRDYSYEKFVDEYATMSTVLLCYYLAFGGPILQQGAVNNAMAARVEFGGKGATEADLPPEELRQRMWWAKAYANFSENFKTFNQYPMIAKMPENLTGLGEWVELPAHLL